MDYSDEEIRQDAFHCFRVGTKPNYDAVEFVEDGNEAIAALRDDAINFVRDYPSLCKDVSVDDLVDDFWNHA